MRNTLLWLLLSVSSYGYALQMPMPEAIPMGQAAENPKPGSAISREYDPAYNDTLSTYYFFLRNGLTDATGTDNGINWFKASTLLENGKVAEAKSQFEYLLAMGNGMAAPVLAEMARNGITQTADPVLALAYYQLSTKMIPGLSQQLGHQQLLQQLNAEQIAAANELTNQFANSLTIKIWERTRYDKSIVIPDPKNIIKFSRRERTKAFFGNAVVYALINESGEVIFTEALSSHPQDHFVPAVSKMLEKRRYQPTGKKQVTTVLFEHAQGQSLHTASLQELIDKHQLWRRALTGEAWAQYQLSVLLELAEIQVGSAHLEFVISIPTEEQPALELLNQRYQSVAYFEQPVDAEFIKDAQGELSSDSLSPALLAAVKAQLNPKAPMGKYRVYSEELYGSKKNAIIDLKIRLPMSLSAFYWRELAAQSGFEPAQRELALFDPVWEKYVAAQGKDPQIMAWHAYRLYIDNNKTEALAMLQRAKQAGYPHAKQFRNWFAEFKP